MDPAEVRKRHVSTGARLRSPQLMEQGTASIARAKEDAAELGARFPAAKIAEMEQLQAQVSGLFGDQAVAKTDVPSATAGERAAFRAAKNLVGDCLAAATNTFEIEEPDVLDAFRAGAKIGQSVSKLKAKIALLVPLATTHAAALDAWGEADLAQRLTAASEAVSAEEAAQEMAMTDLPRKTAELYEAKGKLFFLIKRLNRAAKRVFKDAPEKARRYDLDVVYRRSGASPGGGGAQPTPPAS